jgi:hypothetical protein
MNIPPPLNLLAASLGVIMAYILSYLLVKKLQPIATIKVFGMESDKVPYYS